MFLPPAAVDAIHRLLRALPEEARAATALSIPLTPPAPAPPPPPVALGPRARLERRMQQTQQQGPRASNAPPPPAPPPAPALLPAVLSALLAVDLDAPGLERSGASPPPPSVTATDQASQCRAFLELLLEVNHASTRSQLPALLRVQYRTFFSKTSSACLHVS